MIELTLRQQEHINEIVRGLRPVLSEEDRLETDALLLDMQENGGLTEEALLRLKKILVDSQEQDILKENKQPEEKKSAALTPTAETVPLIEEMQRQTRQYIHFLLIQNRKKTQSQSVVKKRSNHL